MGKRTAVLFVFLACSASLWAQHLPRPIVSYYQDWNFVARNSTGLQRQSLWSAYRRHETMVLSGVEQEVLERMSRVANATDSRHSTMPMLLVETAPPVTPELLVPASSRPVGETRVIVQVRVLQLAGHGASPVGRIVARLFGRGREAVSMCQYTDEWTRRDGRWRVFRSPLVWVSSGAVD